MPLVDPAFDAGPIYFVFLHGYFYLLCRGHCYDVPSLEGT
jgi:hypothetical protein